MGVGRVFWGRCRYRTDHQHVASKVYKDCEEAAQSGVSFDYGKCPFSGFSLPRTPSSSLTWILYILLTVLCSNKALLDAKPSLAETIRPVVKEGTSIVLLQNGVGAEEPLHQAFERNTIVSAVVSPSPHLTDWCDVV